MQKCNDQSASLLPDWLQRQTLPQPIFCGSSFPGALLDAHKERSISGQDTCLYLKRRPVVVDEATSNNSELYTSTDSENFSQPCEQQYLRQRAALHASLRLQGVMAGLSIQDCRCNTTTNTLYLWLDFENDLMRSM